MTENKLIAAIVNVWFLLSLAHSTSAQGRSPRLAGGIPVQIGDFPYLIASVHPEIRCTASLINPSWALGAAHCYIVDSERVNPKDVALIAGIADFNQTRLPSSQIRRAKSINIHPNFEEVKISGADLSLVGVNTPFELNEYVDVIQVSGSPFLLNEDVQCTASGWGDTSTTKTNSHLHKLDVVAVQSKGVCHGLTTKERKNMLCLKSDDGKGLCDGDSGGPLICENELVGVAHQVYIERYKYRGPSDMDCGSKNIVHTYMFTCPYLNWIRAHVRNVPPKPEKCFKLSDSAARTEFNQSRHLKVDSEFEDQQDPSI
ncbi:protease [Nesidiocoris tenuis]|uniref:Protease n=1 Tax=Nesidiocoris tenuis TaxID=355587 RepID=A0ABN7A825_9HEMI|nr:protease [Nesidiocoris tenuis]